MQASVETEDKVVAMEWSSNGYHLASAHASGVVRVWDLRKAKMIAELNNGGDDDLKSVSSLAFHEGGKYLAYGGGGGIHITMAKEWKVLAKIDSVKSASGLVWSSEWMASSTSSGRAVTFHGAAQMEE